MPPQRKPQRKWSDQVTRYTSQMYGCQALQLSERIIDLHPLPSFSFPLPGTKPYSVNLLLLNVRTVPFTSGQPIVRSFRSLWIESDRVWVSSALAEDDGKGSRRRIIVVDATFKYVAVLKLDMAVVIPDCTKYVSKPSSNIWRWNTTRERNHDGRRIRRRRVAVLQRLFAPQTLERIGQTLSCRRSFSSRSVQISNYNQS